MSYTIFASPLHVLPQSLDMPTIKDDLGGGASQYRRQYLRPLSSWELEMPGRKELLDPLMGLLQYAQGDTPIFFDGAGFAEETAPILFGIGIGSITDYRLPHRFVFIASLVIYINGAVYPNWTPLGGDGASTCDAIRFDSGLGVNSMAAAKYRRKVKCVLRTEDKVTRGRVFRSSVPTESIHHLRFILEEVSS